MMGEITRLSLSDVRCFDGVQRARFGKITLIVGENSAGKSTLLGCYNVCARLSNLTDLSDDNSFDRPPFRMGGFDRIARSGARKFSLEGAFSDHDFLNMRFTFVRGEKQYPLEREVVLDFRDRSEAKRRLRFERSQDQPEMWKLDGPGFAFDLDRSAVSYEQFSTWVSEAVRYGVLPYGGERARFTTHGERNVSPSQQAAFARMVSFFRSTLPLSVEPSILVQSLGPGGAPRRFSEPDDPLRHDNPAALRDHLTEKGRMLGLFSDIDSSLRRDGRFETRVNVSGRLRNIVDVGYGVHSVVQVLKEMYGRRPHTVFLLQQPEVQLHPKAQANLAQLMVDSGFRFVIETHSDHLIDRFRICVMQGLLKAEDLSILYLERSADRSSTEIHNIAVDGEGNLLGEPREYRDFFLQEAERLMGFQ